MRSKTKIVVATMLFALAAFPARAAGPNAPAATPAPTSTAPAAATASGASSTAAADGTFTYMPPGCEFRAVFPSQPADGRRCDPDDPSHCATVTGFTHVFGMDASVNFNLTCNPAEPNMYDKYSGASMKAVLEAMVGKGKLATYQTGFKQFDAAKQSVIIGTGRTGNSDKIYIAQLWIGHQSVFTVEGELVGQQNDDADKMFADILKSIRHKDWQPGVKPPAPVDAKTAAAPAAATTTTTTTATASAPVPAESAAPAATVPAAAIPPLSMTTAPDGQPVPTP